MRENTDINECERDPCKNGGVCTDLVANYSCECPGEYMGKNCQYRLMYALGPSGQGPGAGCLCCSDGRLASSSLRLVHHCCKPPVDPPGLSSDITHCLPDSLLPRTPVF
ncbi:hypothetical protein PAMP_022450 [Pampus punctatissimus]